MLSSTLASMESLYAVLAAAGAFYLAHLFGTLAYVYIRLWFPSRLSVNAGNP
jgi:hypothetical protein